MKTIKMALAVIGFAALIGGPASAQTVPAPMTPLATGGLLQLVDSHDEFCYRHPYHWSCRREREERHEERHCRRWGNECAERWGWYTPQYRRCMRIHGC
jgi:hypothetical protein